MEKRVVNATKLAKRAKNTKIADTLNNLVKEYDCKVETDHNDNLTMRGLTENVEKALPIMSVMYSFGEKGRLVLEDGTTFVVLTRKKVA